LWFKQFFTTDLFRKEFLIDKIILMVMCILIIFPIIKLLHQFGGGIPQMQRNRKITGFLYECLGIVDGFIRGIAFGEVAR
jgi:hypothetical protein